MVRKYVFACVVLFSAIFTISGNTDVGNLNIGEFNMSVSSEIKSNDSIRIEPTIPEASLTTKVNQVSGAIIENNNAPLSYSVDKTKEMADIPYTSSVNDTGAKTYTIPLNIFSGINNFQPELTFTYNNQKGSSPVIGSGWSLTGLSSITRVSKNWYYDYRCQGITLLKDDSFELDGIRLIKTGIGDDFISYTTCTGNIKVKCNLNGGLVDNFEVFYPNGTKGTFGYSQPKNTMSYPITILTDIHGNTINFSYFEDSATNTINIKEITYPNGTVQFEYRNDRLYPICHYAGGLKIEENKLLKSVVCKWKNSTLRKYELTYEENANSTLLTRIDYSAEGCYVNPLIFMYGEGESNSAAQYTKKTTQLSSWFANYKAKDIQIRSGRIDYSSCETGFVAYQRKNPYKRVYKESNIFNHSQNRYVNEYTDDDYFFLARYLWWSQTGIYPPQKLGKGFVDVVCADLYGNQKEEVIKINNFVKEGKDHLVFTVYGDNITSSSGELFTREYDFNTTHKDGEGYVSIQPKHYFTGDFDGDGRFEIIAVCVNKPFGLTNHTSNCYIFDLENDSILFKEPIFNYNLQVSHKAESNQIIVFDCDGDGKTDLCHIHENGTTIYSFSKKEQTSSSNNANRGPKGPLKYQVLASNESPKCNLIESHQLLLGDFNGDGLADILFSPAKGGNTWSLHSSKGNGKFDISLFTGPVRSSDENSGFIALDINKDGVSDLLKYDESNIVTYVTQQSRFTNATTIAQSSKEAIILPVNVNSRHRYSQFIVINPNGIINHNCYSQDVSRNSQLTAFIDSRGVIEKNYYTTTDKEGELASVFEKGSGAIFPNVNVVEFMYVLAKNERYYDNTKTDHSTYSYKNAVFHKQGLGFCGFEQMSQLNNRNHLTTKTFAPYSYPCLLIQEQSPKANNIYTYNITIDSLRLTKINLQKKEFQDLLKDITVTSSYTYDSYGFPLTENILYSNGASICTTNKYSHNTAASDGYNLGFKTEQEVVHGYEGEAYIEKMNIVSHNNRLPLETIYRTNSAISSKVLRTYDSRGNVLTERRFPYSSTIARNNEYSYDEFGRLISETDEQGRCKSYTYDDDGLVTSNINERGGISYFTHDEFGRLIEEIRPDSTKLIMSYLWSQAEEPGLYCIGQQENGKAETKKFYNALDKEVRHCEQGLEDAWYNVDKEYDIYGNLSKESLPYKDGDSKLWNEYSYDSYDRVLSFNEASGRVTIYSYDGNSISTQEDMVTTTRTYDAQNRIISATNPSGTINYNYRPNGLIESISAIDAYINFEYDAFGRRTKISDTTSGAQTFQYDNSGNISKETNAKNEAISYVYDDCDRLVSKQTPEFATEYEYDAFGDLNKITSNNGTSKQFTYDAMGRILSDVEKVANGAQLKRVYSYSNGNISKIVYSTTTPVGTENRYYSNGRLKRVTFRGSPIYTLEKENVFGMPTQVVSGSLKKIINYDSYGYPTGRSASVSTKVYQNEIYGFSHARSVLAFRRDVKRNFTENFVYDSLNRLTKFGSWTTAYDVHDNITSKSDVGTMNYTISRKPYTLASINLTGSAIPEREQKIEYYSFGRPSKIEENGYVAQFYYNEAYERIKMEVNNNGVETVCRYYLGNCLELEARGTGKLYIGGDFYSAPAVYVFYQNQVQKSSSIEKALPSNYNIYYIVRDFLGSVTHVFDYNYTLKQELSYDAWGRLRTAETKTPFAPDKEPTPLFRGYCGHEHLTWFGLVNMNARLYDPAIGRFLSPDPYVQMPDCFQNFNRYSYALNNPFSYKDEDGESIVAAIVVGAVIGGIANVAIHWEEITSHDGWDCFWRGAGYFGIGAAAGGLSVAGAVGATAALSAVAGTSTVSGILSGVTYGAVDGAINGFVLNTSNAYYNGASFHESLDFGLKSLGKEALSGAATGGLMYGGKALFQKANIFTGKGGKVDYRKPSGPTDKKYKCYYGLDSKKDVKYVGMTGREFEVRVKEHLRSKTPRANLEYVINNSFDYKIQARIWEQQEIIKFGMMKEGGKLLNLRNEIDKRKWDYYNIVP